jgi:hyaluronan synthase
MYSVLLASLGGPRRRQKEDDGRLPRLLLRRRPKVSRSIKALLLLAAALTLIAAMQQSAEFQGVLADLGSHRFGWWYLAIGKTVLLLNMAALIWHAMLAVRYRPVPACADSELPVCTVIVPAYNEGKQVLRTLRSIARSDYPAEKLEIIGIDDGSRDDTWRWIQKAAAEFPSRIEAVRQPRNRGKRRALYEGFTRGRGTVFVTIDSDSLVETRTLRHLVGPMVRDARVGAVAGNIAVLNRHDGIIPRMLDVIFTFSFDFVRSGQSEVNAVFCTPGALSAYRREPVMSNVHAWLEQTFMGRSATIGEDRAMTNLILRAGYHVKYESEAVVYTNVPTAYGTLCKMFLRWARSNIRESLVMAGFIFGRFRTAPALGMRLNFLLGCLNLTVPRFLQLGLLACLLTWPGIFLVQVSAGTAISALVPAVFYGLRRRSSDAVWALAYNLFWAAALWWITPYAMLTVRNGKWLTRDMRVGAQGVAAVPVAPT